MSALVRVVSNTLEAATETVYNFEVEGAHNYFADEFGLWAHNARSGTSGENPAAAAGRLFHQQFDFGPGFRKEPTIPGGLRPDAVNFDTGIVCELNGSRALGSVGRDFDFVISGASKSELNYAKWKLPKGPRGIPYRQDIFDEGGLDDCRPFITFFPQG